jgi:hypothetical protein
MGEDDEDGDDDDGVDDEDYVLVNEEQEAAVKRVLSKKRGDHYGILGIEEGSPEAVVLQSFI